MHSGDDLQPRRDSDAHFNTVSQIDLGQERVEGIHFRTRKLLSIRLEDSNSGLDESSSEKTSTAVADMCKELYGARRDTCSASPMCLLMDKETAEQNKGGSSNKGALSTNLVKTNVITVNKSLKFLDLTNAMRQMR